MTLLECGACGYTIETEGSVAECPRCADPWVVYGSRLRELLDYLGRVAADWGRCSTHRMVAGVRFVRLMWLTANEAGDQQAARRVFMAHLKVAAIEEDLQFNRGIEQAWELARTSGLDQP